MWRAFDSRTISLYLILTFEITEALCSCLLPWCISSRGCEWTVASARRRVDVTWQQQVIIFAPSLHEISQKQYEIYFQRYWWRWQNKNCYTQSKVSSNNRRASNIKLCVSVAMKLQPQDSKESHWFGSICYIRFQINIYTAYCKSQNR